VRQRDIERGRPPVGLPQEEHRGHDDAGGC
jgi:hypothetical protein